jgi:DHA1 family inner membrane transport protein
MQVTTTASTPAAHPRLALLALALGGFAIGTTEFVTMGLLKEIADGIDVSIPTAGHIITAYAFGVVVGAPLIVSLAAKLPRKALVVGLALAIGVFNGLTAVVDGYAPVMVVRFLAGLPHGAYFGVAALVASSLVAPERRARAISMVMMGLSVATVVGVPASTWLGQALGWRSAYVLVLAVAVAAALSIAVLVPHRPADTTASLGRELRALRRPQVHLAAAAGSIGFAGMFAMYSYISPIVTDVTDLSKGAIPWFLLAFGLGSLVGTWVAGPLTDRSINATVLLGLGGMAVLLLVLWPLMSWAVPTFALVFLVAAFGSLVAISLQVRLMHAAGEAEMLGAALNHSALNVANGLGAWLGSVVIAAGWGYRAPTLVGAGLAAAGIVIFLVGVRVERSALAAEADAELEPARS